ncbi:DNA cytosine methyltransferase [Nesterenkonia cremea]|uniref:Cytosine-specific methyltransferase n=1 Tax=Nesterenkonia cremea TaxID=1882340 RepID=A0A917APG4_9MICC|nr:DNA cytosine methyltransferase [Nesterenkonia cremea]GGE65019.1 cytosine-specific methyltransferase [Nesterenkonia cremea]
MTIAAERIADMAEHEGRFSTQERTKTFRFGELFSGPGGLGLAATNASRPGYEIVHQWATDYDADTCRTYAANVCGDEGHHTVVHHDIRTLDYDILAERGGIDGLAFGFPCNDFSVVGERKAFDGEFGPLYTYGVRALERFQPEWFLAENVGGIRADGGRVLRKIFRDMMDAGYRIYPHYYKFEEYGVPQARHRMIVIGIRNDVDVEFKVPSPDRFKAEDVSARTALANIPSWAKNQEPTKQSERVIERLNHIPAGGNAWHADMPEHLQIKTNTRLSSIYRRLHPDKPAYTVTGSGGGGTHIYHWEEPRALTNRERARLQTFPDDFEFRGSKESVRKQIGMAVPPQGAQVIFEALLDSYAGIEYDSVPPSLEELTLGR